MNRYRSLRAESLPTVTGDGRTVRVRLVAWGTPSTVTDDGGTTWYSESFARGGLQAPPDVNVVMPARAGHNADPVGRIIAVDDLDDGLYADVRLAATPKADEQIALIDEGLLSVSIEFDDVDGSATHGTHVERTTAVLTGLAFTDTPQHSTAAVIGRRSHEGTTMPHDPDPTLPEPAAPEAPAAPVGHHERGHDAAPAAAGRPDPAVPHRRAVPAADPVTGRFRSFGDFTLQAAQGRVELAERARYYRALSSSATLADATVQTQWINDVIDLVAVSQPTVGAFSSRPLPDQGTTVSQPVITTRPTVAKQAAQGDALSSQKVVISPVSWTVETYGGGQGMSVQTVLRSTPSYLNEVMRLYAAEMAAELEEAVVAGVLAAADDVHTAVELDASGTGTVLVDAFIDAAAKVLGSAGIGRMPELVVGNVKMWTLLAKAKDSTGRPLFPGISPLNPVGRMDLSSADGEVRGLRFVCAPKMDDTRARAVLGVADAYRSMIGPLQTLQADVPETLTQERAVFQFAAHGKVDARGLVLVDNAS